MPRRDIEDSVDRAVQMGRDNQRLIELIQAHCANARVVPEGGSGLVEEHTGLPIGMRSIRCDHAAAPSGMAHNLAFLAEDFYRGNCVGCPHRKPRRIPNLATWCEERAAEGARQQELARVAEEERLRSLEGRRAVRRHLRLSENDAGRELLDLLDRIDGRDPGEEGRQDAEERLVATVRAAPELLSAGVVEALFAVAEVAEAAALRALALWVQPGSRLADRLLRIAVRLLAEGPDPHAAGVFAEFANGATPQDVEQVIDSAMSLAGRIIWWEPDNCPAAFLAAARVSLPLVLDAICRHLDDALSPSTVAVGAGAAEHLIGQEPGAASILVPKLLEALPRVMHVRGQHPDPDAWKHAIVRALRAAFLARPAETADSIDRVALARPVEERERLFAVYTDTIDPRDGVDVPVEARRIAIARVVARATGDWDLEVAVTAASDVEHLAQSHPEELARCGRTLVGTLLEVLDDRADPAHRLEMLADPTRRLEEESRRSVRGRWIRSLANAVGHVVGADEGGTGEAFADVLTLYDATVAEGVGTTNAGRELRRRLLGAFPALATSPGHAAALIPRLYSALVDADVGVRATAIDVCRRWVADPGYPLPELMRALVPALLGDTYVAVHKAMIRAITAIRPLPESAGQVVVSLIGWAITYATTDPGLSCEAAAEAVRLARTRGSDAASSIVGYALTIADRFDDPWATRDVLHATSPYADRHAVWTRLAVRLVATRHWLDSGEPDPAIRQRLLEMSDVNVRGALSEIEISVTACLPDHPGMAWNWIELLQAAGMWQEAGRVASRIVERIPGTTEYAPRRRYAEVMRTATLVEAALAVGDPALAHQWAVGVAGEGQASRRLAAWCEVRRLIVEALGDASAADRAHHLEAAAIRLRAIVSHQPADRRRRLVEAYCRTLDLLSYLARWDAAVQDADENADRWRQAAMRKAELATAEVEGTPLAPLVAQIQTIDRLSAVDDLRRSTLAIPLPILIADAPYAVRSRKAAARRPRPPVGVCLLEMDGTPVSTLVLVQPDHLYDLRVTIHVPEWPEWAETLEVAFNAPTAALELPSLTLHRPDGVAAHVTVTDLDRCRLAGTQSSFAEPLVCDVMAELRGPGRRQNLRVAGMPRIRLRAADPARDAPYGDIHTEGELIAFFDRLRGQGLPDDEVKTFCRFFAALVAAAKRLYVDRQFRGGGSMRESQFQDAFEKILGADPRLGGRVRRVVLAGGVTDLVHDQIVAELKVERTTPATIDGAHKYVGQPAQYSVDADAQLSILCILDWTKKKVPVGKPENYWGWLVPDMHGMEHPAHPSVVGVLIINVNLPRPSSWSRRRIEASSLDAAGPPDAGAQNGTLV